MGKRIVGASMLPLAIGGWIAVANGKPLGWVALGFAGAILMFIAGYEWHKSSEMFPRHK